VGNDSAIPRLKRICQELRITDCVNFVGHQTQNQLLSQYAKADLFLMPSLTEAFGVAILEAMAAGIPVIASRTGGIPEIIQDGGNGALISPGCPKELAAAILDLIGNASKFENYHHRGLVTAHQFSSDIMISETWKLYSNVLKHS